MPLTLCLDQIQCRDASSSSLLSPTWRDERPPPQVLPALCSPLRTHLRLPRIPLSLLGAILDGPPFPHSKRHADRLGVQHVPHGTRVQPLCGAFFLRGSLLPVETAAANKTMIVPRTPLQTVIYLNLMEHDNNI